MSKKQKIGIAIASVFILLIAGLILFDLLGQKEDSVSPTSELVEYRTEFLMDTFIEYKLYGEQVKTAIDEMSAALKNIEQLISMHLQDSEVSKINQNAGKQAVEVSDITFAYLKRSKELSEKSQGMFDITVGPLTQLWHVTSETPHIPASEEIEKSKALVDIDDLVLDEEARTAKLNREGQVVDLGGIAKGLVCSTLQEIGTRHNIQSGYVSLGGNLVIFGQKPQGGDFIFGVRNPRGTDSEYIGTVTLPNQIMATTGDYERYFIEDGVRYHHIMDPRSGSPAASDLISVSVIAKDGGLADFLSTTLFVAGKEKTLAYLKDERFSLIVVDQDLNVYCSEQLKGIFKPNQSASGFTFLTDMGE